MAGYIHISKLSTLNFEPDNQKSFEDKVSYCQKLHLNDPVLVQFAGDSIETFSYAIVNLLGTIVRSGGFSITAIDSTLNVLEIQIAGLPQDIYTFQLFQTTNNPSVLLAESSVFCVTDNVDNTTLLAYTNNVNDYDTIFITNTVRMFNFRFEGGLLNSGMKHAVETNNFRNQFQEIRQLYQMPYKTKELTIGGPFGVPDWIAEKINFIFCCSNVYVNGIKHSRSEKEAPAREIIAEGYPFFNFKMIVEGEPDIYTTGIPVFSSDWIAAHGSMIRYGTWINNGMTNNIYL